MKYFIDFIDDQFSQPKEASTFMWVASIITLLLAFAVFIIAAAFENDELTGEDFAVLVPYLTFKVFNTLYMIGIIINLGLLLYYIRSSEQNLARGNRLKSIRAAFFYTIFGYGGFNLLWIPALFTVMGVFATAMGVSHTTKKLKNTTENGTKKVVERLQKNNIN